MTRSTRIDGKPTLPSRWLQRLDTVLLAAGLSPALLTPRDAQALLAVARLGDHSDIVAPASRPAPTPPAENRLSRISVTQVEKLMSNPYGVYAQEILRLPKLDEIDMRVDPRMRGTFVHDVLNEFTEKFQGPLPDQAHQIIIDLGHAQRTAMAAMAMQRSIISPASPISSKRSAEMRNNFNVQTVEVR